MAFYSAISRRFSICDRYHCSILGPTFPNREYLHSANSGGIKNNALPFQVGYPNGFDWVTIWDRLAAAGVPARYYYVDLPVVALWGQRLLPYSSTIANYLIDAAAGTLPNVVFIDPGFVGELRSDEHPHGDIRDGQRLVDECLRAFVASPHWERGVFILTYDEWGGFYDHVRPARFKDDRASRVDDENFGQGGFRVPTRIISPYARENFVDHTLSGRAEEGQGPCDRRLVPGDARPLREEHRVEPASRQPEPRLRHSRRRSGDDRAVRQRHHAAAADGAPAARPRARPRLDRAARLRDRDLEALGRLES
jgi:phospholipase C